MTPHARAGSKILAVSGLVISTSCTAADAVPSLTEARKAPHPESCLGIADKGIFGDLDPKVQLVLPAKLSAEQVTATIDRTHGVLVLSIDGFPRKAYPLGMDRARTERGDRTITLAVGNHELALR